jgi:hypothetical protein
MVLISGGPHMAHIPDKTLEQRVEDVVKIKVIALDFLIKLRVLEFV